MNNFDNIQTTVTLLSEQIQAESYDSAISTIQQLDGDIRRLTSEQLLALSNEQKQYLYQVAQWLNDEDEDLKQRSKQLIKTIAPFNRAGALKTKKQY